MTVQSATPVTDVEAQLLDAVAALTKAVQLCQEAIDSLRSDVASLGDLVAAR